MPEPRTPSDSESEGEEFVFMDSVQAIFSSINPFGRSETPLETRGEARPRSALAEQEQGSHSSEEPVVSAHSEDAIESRLRQNKALFESLANPDLPPSIAGYSDKTPRRKGKGVAQLAANFEPRAGSAVSAASSQSNLSMTATRMTPLQGYKGPTPQLTSALVFDAFRVGTPQSLPPPATPTSMPPEDSSRGSIAAPGTPLSIPPEEDEYGLDHGQQAPTQTRLPSLILPQTMGFPEIQLAELKPSTELQTYSVFFVFLLAPSPSCVAICDPHHESALTEYTIDTGTGEQRKRKIAAAGSFVARDPKALDPTAKSGSDKHADSGSSEI